MCVSFSLSPVLLSRSFPCMALRDRLKLVGGVALVAWAAGLQVRKRMALCFDWLALIVFCFSFVSQPRLFDRPPPEINHHQIHIWHLQSQPEFKERFPDVRDPEDRDQKD